MGKVDRIAPAVEMFCAECKTELLVPYLTRRKPRRVLCFKCFKGVKK